VKDQCKEGFIEIELKGKPGARGSPSKNLVVRRNLFAGKKTSSFTLNGSACTGKEINTKIAELNIQVGNLWYVIQASVQLEQKMLIERSSSFLPQDKVAEFARMNSMQLLRETQRAAGDNRLTEWHNTLIESGKEQRDLTEVNFLLWVERRFVDERLLEIECGPGPTQDCRRTKSSAWARRRAIPAAHGSRARSKFNYIITQLYLLTDYVVQIAILELALPFVQYTIARKEFYRLKEIQRKKHQRADRLKARQGPAESLKKY
jgi:hypothetical protein